MLRVEPLPEPKGAPAPGGGGGFGGNRDGPLVLPGEYTATGLDIYDKSRVRREILELRAAIERGDSGGPLVLENGTVGGVVFAESRTNESVGYALSPTAVAILNERLTLDMIVWTSANTAGASSRPAWKNG